MTRINFKPKPSTLFFWGLYDWATSAYSVIIVTFVFSSYFVNKVAPDKNEGVALWGLAIGIAGLLVAVGGPVLGAFADQSGRRKLWMAPFTAICIACTYLLWFVKPSPEYMLPALCLIAVATATSDFAYVFYNAMLPELAGPEKIGRWSGWGWAMGYAGGMASLIVCLLVFIESTTPLFGLEKTNAENVRATFVLAAAWFTVFVVPFYIFTPATGKSSPDSIWNITINSFKQLWGTFRRIEVHKNAFQFLIGRMIYTDALITLFTFGGVYASAMFNMDEKEVMLFGISLNISAGIGAGIFAVLDDYFGGKKMIVASLACLILSGSVALLSVSETEFWIAGLVLGLFVGPVQASSRSYFARVVPEDLRNQMFGFFAFSAKATAFLGPMTISWLTYVTGSLRIGMSSIIIFLVIGLLIVLPLKKDKD